MKFEFHHKIGSRGHISAQDQDWFLQLVKDVSVYHLKFKKGLELFHKPESEEMVKNLIIFGQCWIWDECPNSFKIELNTFREC